MKDSNNGYDEYMRLAVKYKSSYQHQIRNGYFFADVFKEWFYDVLREAKAAGHKLDITLE